MARVLLHPSVAGGCRVTASFPTVVGGCPPPGLLSTLCSGHPWAWQDLGSEFRDVPFPPKERGSHRACTMLHRMPALRFSARTNPTSLCLALSQPHPHPRPGSAPQNSPLSAPPVSRPQGWPPSQPRSCLPSLGTREAPSSPGLIWGCRWTDPPRVSPTQPTVTRFPGPSSQSPLGGGVGPEFKRPRVCPTRLRGLGVLPPR